LFFHYADAVTFAEGLAFFFSCQKFREGVRIEIMCGKRALNYLSAVYEQAKSVGQKLSVKPADTFAAVERLEGELLSVKYRMAELETELFDYIANGCAGQNNILMIRGEMRPDAVRRLADSIAQKASGLTAVFSGTDGHYAYALIHGDGTDINPIVKAMNSALNGRGGGRNGFAQGSVQTDRASIEAFFANK
jgi:alanyl-tRNA synthetase